MADLTRESAAPQKQVAIGNNAPTYTGADGDIDQVLVSSASAKGPLSQDSGVAIVDQAYGHFQSFLKDTP
jgi:hypothetical protein